EKHVHGWDDPRMPTISGMRRRGYPPKAIRDFCDVIGVTKKDSSISMSTLESSVRSELESFCPRYLGVVDPIKVTITNWEDGKIQEIEAPLHPKDESFGTRKLFFTKEIFIDRDDFMEEPPKKFFRLKPGGNVRLRYGYVITCDEVIKDDKGIVVELKCTYHPESFAGKTPEGMKKVKGIIHWVSATHSKKVTFNIYDRLFISPAPGKEHGGDFHKDINPESLIERIGYLEQELIGLEKEKCFQLERTGYFVQDKDSTTESLKFNRIITLKDTWAKLEKGK
ncbi:MAG: glutamate--tRNA ligase family protein, partial [Bdellovibrionales bacterium]|nr:glutamate--tRNA ligase family protein [Bdellovibrionales bacterium]